MRKILVLAASLAFALTLAPAFSVVASADEAAPRSPAPTFEPPSAVIRHIDAARLAAPTGVATQRSREVVVLVGGYQSCSCDHTFDALTKVLVDAGFDVVRFGSDPAFPYDTLGSIAENAVSLRDQVRRLGADYSEVHLVTYSMGGLVADVAFENGLSRDDGVASYVAWSPPHNGSFAAGIANDAREAFGGDGGIFRDAALVAGWETDSAAMRDLRPRIAAPRPEGVLRLDVLEMTDALVTTLDAMQPGVETRILGHGTEGHVGILDDQEAIALTLETIRSGGVPPDSRSLVERLFVGLTAALMTIASIWVFGLVGTYLRRLGLLNRTPLMAPFDRFFQRWSPPRRAL